MPRAVAEIAAYHAHVYFDGASRDAAARLREAIAGAFEVRLGRWHERPVGPHPKSMYQVAFATSCFATLVPWLMLNRDGLDVLVHPETGDDLVDHRDHALWLGDKLKLRLDVFGAPPAHP